MTPAIYLDVKNGRKKKKLLGIFFFMTIKTPSNDPILNHIHLKVRPNLFSAISDFFEFFAVLLVSAFSRSCKIGKLLEMVPENHPKIAENRQIDQNR